MTEKLRILLAEDHQTVREGIKLLVNSQSDMEVIGEAGDGELAIKMAAELRPDLLLMDISMPTMNGLSLIEELRAMAPAIRVVVSTGLHDDRQRAALLALGVTSIVPKPCDRIDILTAVQRELAMG